MVTTAILIRRNLYIKKQKRIQKVTIRFLVDQQKRKESMDTQVAAILYVQIVCYVILMTPQMGNVTYNAIVSTIPNRSMNSLAVDRMIAFLAELMMYVFPVFAFYLYTLSSPTFRSELWNIMGPASIFSSQRQNRQINPVIPSILINSPNKDYGSRLDPSPNLTKAQLHSIAVIS
ncbi:unnamed protein product [Rotaria sp. Silwood1]|nr:unnamed protein product [Rotaria sp. Silwood1]CAF1181495.1 unnamed protein product [Rotaria sp. Silwood1]